MCQGYTRKNFIFNFAKFKENFSKHKTKNFAKISRNYKNENFAATLLLHNLRSATHPPLPSARRFFNVAWQCYFEIKTNTEPYFSILSSIILCCTPTYRIFVVCCTVQFGVVVFSMYHVFAILSQHQNSMSWVLKIHHACKTSS